MGLLAGRSILLCREETLLSADEGADTSVDTISGTIASTEILGVSAQDEGEAHQEENQL